MGLLIASIGLASSLAWAGMFHIRDTSPLLLGPCCLCSDPASELFHLARQCDHVDRAVYVPPAHAAWTCQCHLAQHPSAAACCTHSEVSPWTAASLSLSCSAGLINQHRDNSRCINIGRGGECASGGSPHYLYLLIGHNSLLRRSR